MVEDNQSLFDEHEDRQELDWQAEVRETDEVPENHRIFVQLVWVHLMGQTHEKKFYFSHEGVPSSTDIYAAIFSQKPEWKAYKSGITLYGEPSVISRELIPKGQSILSFVDLNVGDNDPNIEEIKLD